MNNKLFRRLAVSNLNKNASTILPYLLTCILVFSLSYVISSFSMNSGLKTVSGGNFTVDVMKFGSLIFIMLSALFLLYTNSFLMKRRKKELGLYHVLGLEKKHIRRILGWETSINAAVSICGGLLLGVGINPLLTISLSKLINADLPFSEAVTFGPLLKTSSAFIFIFVMTFLYNVHQIHTVSSIELLKGGEQGEKEPKAKWGLAILGAVLLLCGYMLSFQVNDPKQDIIKMGGAVICVGISTYLLFIAVSIVVLKLLRNNKEIYYRSKNFTLISGMLYRMKHNAVGLSNICILSTATLLVMITTISLYFGINHVLDNSFNRDISIVSTQADKEKQTELIQFLDENKEKYAIQKSNELKYSGGKFAEDLNGDGNIDFFFLMTTNDYNRLTGKEVTLSKEEALLFSKQDNLVTDRLMFSDGSIEVKEHLKEFPVDNDYSNIYGSSWLYIVTDPDGTLADHYGLSEESNLYYEFDLEGKGNSKSAISYAIGEKAESIGDVTVESKYVFRDSLITRFGGLLFLGMLISLILLMETALSIFYKQLSEGYDDKERFKILAKVGMSQKEIQMTVRKQILVVFYSPLILSLFHMVAALPMLYKLLRTTFMDNLLVIAASVLLSAVVFIFIYGLVFLFTEKAYRKILTPKSRIKGV